ncbi:molybdopterin-dependent oxidoreductase [Oryzomonas japonica]|uniref:NADPH-Fe(3+) oxidoreductase subunit alpha n=1 Tax=Oryzomonas japonica TaxID=2603858 RepID=A0A7J4ZRU8_9BACT|nr:molybdopterin-dependent oxidoreductase [Oryzomonas japonica]KAB0665379.1 molybdopterin-dependent oxidoreductase [Oryzomonas japonica]
MVTLTIDGRQIQVPAGTTILDAAAGLGIKIPTLCWLKKVSTTGACRICVVEIEGVDRFMTACNTPVKDGIVVTTTSPQLEKARKKTLELMLVNHPLDCPVCDAGGECDLQDTCFALKVDRNEYAAEREPLPIIYDWPLIENCSTRCILCEKCVKVCHEIVGADAIEVKNCGDRSLIGTVDGKPLNCDFCGNCINACPTGTLISKPFKFRGRPWTFDVTRSVCAFCSSGCQIDYHSRDGRVERVTSSDDGFNRGNLCINGRFGYAAFNSSGRLTEPLLKDVAGKQQEVGWDQALSTVAARLKDIVSASGGASVAGIGSPRVTNEESYLFQKFLRCAVGTNNIDSEARLGYFPAQLIQWRMLGYSGGTAAMDAIEQATAVVVLGSDLKAESAGFAYRVIRAVTRNDAKLVVAGARASWITPFANAFLQYRSGSEAWLVAGLNKAILAEGLENKAFIDADTKEFAAFTTALGGISYEQIVEASGVGEAELREAARLIGANGRVAVIYGAEIMRSVDAANAVTGVVNLSLLTGAAGTGGAGIYPLDEKNNTQGMLDMGVCPEYLPGYHGYDHAAARFAADWKAAVPAVPGKDLFQIVEGIEKGEIRALYVMGSDPLHFMPDRNRILKALQKLDLLVVQDLFLTDTARLAHIVLPAASGAEKSGSFTSVDNRVQCFPRAVAPAGDARTDGEILAKLHDLVSPVANITAASAEDLHHEIARLTGLYSEQCDHEGCRMGRAKNRPALSDKPATFAPVTPTPPARRDGAYPLSLIVGPVLHHNGTFSTWSDNNMAVAGEAYVEIAPADARKAGITTGSAVKISSSRGSIILTARVLDTAPEGTLFVPVHFREAQVNLLTQGAGATVGAKLEKA